MKFRNLHKFMVSDNDGYYQSNEAIPACQVNNLIQGLAISFHNTRFIFYLDDYKLLDINIPIPGKRLINIKYYNKFRKLPTGKKLYDGVLENSVYNYLTSIGRITKIIIYRQGKVKSVCYYKGNPYQGNILYKKEYTYQGNMRHVHILKSTYRTVLDS